MIVTVKRKIEASSTFKDVKDVEYSGNLLLLKEVVNEFSRAAITKIICLGAGDEVYIDHEL